MEDTTFLEKERQKKMMREGKMVKQVESRHSRPISVKQIVLGLDTFTNKSVESNTVAQQLKIMAAKPLIWGESDEQDHGALGRICRICIS